MAELGSVSSYTLKRGKKTYTYYRIRLPLNGVMRSIHNHKGVQFKTREAAQQVLEHIRFLCAQEGADRAAVISQFLPKRSKPNLVTELLDQYLEDVEERAKLGELSYNTARGLRWQIKGDPRKRGPAPWSWWRGVGIHEVRKHHITKFRRHLEAKGQEDSTVALRLRQFRGFMLWCQDQEIIASVPAFKMPSVSRRRPRLLTPSQQRAALDAIPWERRGVFLLMALGVRPASARAVLVEDVQDGFIIARRSCQGGEANARVVEHTKNRREVWIPLTRELSAWIQEHARDRHPKARLFWNPTADGPGQHWAHPALTREWKAASAQAGIPYVPLYQAMKHSFATGRLMAGVSKDALGEFLGITPKQVDTYAQWARELSAQVLPEEDLADAVRARVTELRGGQVANESEET